MRGLQFLLAIFVAVAAGLGAAFLVFGMTPYGSTNEAGQAALEIIAFAATVAGLGLLMARRWLPALIVLLLALAAGAGAYYLLVTRAPPPSPRSALLLPDVRTWPGGDIPLCWLNRPAKGSESASDLNNLGAVEAAETTWSKAGAVHFHDAGNCPTDFKGVKLLIRRTAGDADTPDLGVAIAEQAEPVVLLFAFPSRSGCSSGGAFGSAETCVYGEAVHEFGHVLGLPDEHYSQAAPDPCKATLRQDHRWLAIPYDAASVMNACNPDHLFGRLSPLDIAATRQIYGAPA